ncbi:hypothetical protein ACXRSW_09000 [Aeromonas dhakensis]|uniref:hypothetical protein n=1 Tax=Aeromonas dhakensis TaxID=196024 RepID=UPI0020B224B0|nr:hypothetical protein [Aeromonas dhakensis]WPS57094.1 hypothetical protein RDV79_00170 [Aeromonas dhakensis]WRT74619.1 hypothetical protein VK677_08170 [Aeromonas dhakensis]CAD7491876.1 hypothetical protein KBAD45_26390 [Aeromonas dhakensis]CAD7514256.1 hypothetical protein KBAD50_16130 [Aeromonas dhakensis]CAD7514597.1 hypothetical protein KBAD49_16130 [Aeromonas dhakensis]
MEDTMQLIIRIGNRVVDERVIERPEKQLFKDDVYYIPGGKCIVDYMNQKTLALQLVTQP